MYLLMNKNEKLLSFSIDTLLRSEEITEKERFFLFSDANMVEFRKNRGIGLCANTNGWNN